MDGHDRKELSAIEKAKKEHFERYGSILACPERDTICSFMDGAWISGCRRVPCIKDDPEDIALQLRIKEKRRQTAAEKKESADPPAPIRNQSKLEERRMQQRVDQLYADAREMYRNNKPRIAEQME